LFLQHPHLFLKLLNDALLVPVHPPGQVNQHETNRIHPLENRKPGPIVQAELEQ